jgi:hypothetical protein
MRPDSLKEALICWAISLLIPTIAFCLLFFLRGRYDLAGTINALLLGGASMLGCILLFLLGRTGIFDIASYSFTRLFESFKVGNPKSYQDAGEYCEKKKLKRAQSKVYWFPFALVGGLIVIACIVLSLIETGLH